MPNIPVFNNGDTLQTIRINSLNPLITKVNAMEAQLDFSSNLKDGEVPIWDDTHKKFVSSGVTAEEGSLKIAPSSVEFGNHIMSSSVAGVQFRNDRIHKVFSPAWVEVKPDNNEAFYRAYGTQEEVVRQPDGSQQITPSTLTGVVVDADEIFLGVEFKLVNPARDLVISATDLQGELVWRSEIGDKQSGDVKVIFSTPMELSKGFVYDVSITSRAGDTVTCLGVNNKIYWKVTRAPMEDIVLAKQVDFNKAITNIAIVENNKLQMTFGNGNQSKITLPDQTPPDYATYKGKVDNVETTQQQLSAKVAKLEGDVPSKPDSKEVPQFFGAFGSTWPTSLTGATQSVGKRVTITKANDDASRAFIIMPIDHASAVQGIKMERGIASLWTSTDKDIGGKDYRVYVSPNTFHERSATLVVDFSQEKEYV